MQKVIIVKSMNVTPEEELAERLAQLGDGWRVVSVSTNIATWGEIDLGPENSFGSAKHVYYVTTALLEKSD